jgi:hypothetical protein
VKKRTKASKSGMEGTEFELACERSIENQRATLHKSSCCLRRQHIPGFLYQKRNANHCPMAVWLLSIQIADSIPSTVILSVAKQRPSTVLILEFTVITSAVENCLDFVGNHLRGLIAGQRSMLSLKFTATLELSW